MSWIRGSARQPIAAVILIAVWIPALAFGIQTLLRYANTPGRPASPPNRWPANAPVAPADPRFTLLIFAHPQCPCSRATIGELARIVSRYSDKMRALVFFYSPSTMPKNWTRTDLWDSAKAIPGVRVLDDPEGYAARSFGVHTSGQTLLYDTHRRLVFKGGITAFRGHMGDNDGSDEIEALLRGDPHQHHSLTPVFGCSLFGETVGQP